jgi:hypothetical protein
VTVGPAEADILAQECVTAGRTHLAGGTRTPIPERPMAYPVLHVMSFWIDARSASSAPRHGRPSSRGTTIEPGLRLGPRLAAIHLQVASGQEAQGIGPSLRADSPT